MYNLSINNIANHGFTFFQETIFESLKSNSKRIVAIALIALSCLTAIYLAYQCCSASDEDPFVDPYIPPKPTPFYPKPTPYTPPVYTSAFSLGALSQFKNAIYAIKPQEKRTDSPKDLTTVAEEKKCLKAIKSSWLDDPQQELARVLNAKLLPDSIQKAIYQPATPQVSQVFSVIGRTLEIKNLYYHSHYVFTHGQAPELSFANLLIKECIRLFTPRQYQSLKIPFRLPHTVTYSENADDFIKKYNATANSAYQDNSHNTEMISVDGQFWNGDQCESALDFFSTATNINLNRGDSELVKIFKSIFINYLPNHTLCNLFAEKALKIAKQRKSETLVGVLYAICIPKEIVKDEKKNFAYHCHPFGKQCNCFPGKDRIELLEEMQNDKLVRCTTGTLTQYRLLTSRLAEEKDVRSFAINALSKDKRKFYRNQAKELVKEVAQYSLLYDLIERLDQDPSVMDQISSLIESSSNIDPNYIQHLFDEKGNGSKKHGQEPWMEGLDPSLIASLMDQT